MFCILWAIFQTLAAVVEGGVSSGSAEALANGGVNNNGAAAGNNANPQNGLQINGEPLLAQLVQLGGSLFIQPVGGNQVGQAPLQQLIPIGGLQQGGAFLVGQGANVNPLQGQVTPQGARGGPVTLLAVLPHRNAGGNPQQGALLTPNQVQLISLAGLNNQQQPGGAAGGGRAAGRLRFQRSVAARLRRTRSPVMMKATEAEEEEEFSGTVVEEKPAK